MLKLHELTPEGVIHFQRWLDGQKSSASPPLELLNDPLLAVQLGDVDIDETQTFRSRLEFGQYLNTALGSFNAQNLLKPERDGLWAWLAVVYFKQLAPAVIRRWEHYIVIRRGSAGSLAHRQAARTAYMLVAHHGTNAIICLNQPMHTHGQLLESLSAKQSVALNRAFFGAASLLYMKNGRRRRGATSKPKDPADRRPGETTGMGSVRRLPLALERLDLTYDVERLDAAQLVAKLPREFAHWTST